MVGENTSRLPSVNIRTGRVKIKREMMGGPGSGRSKKSSVTLTPLGKTKKTSLFGQVTPSPYEKKKKQDVDKEDEGQKTDMDDSEIVDTELEKTGCSAEATNITNLFSDEESTAEDDESSTMNGSAMEDGQHDDEINKIEVDNVTEMMSNSKVSGVTDLNFDMGNASGTMYDYLAMPKGTNITKPPRPRQINKPQESGEIPETMHRIHLKMRKQLDKESGNAINIVDHFKLLLSRMIHEVQNLLLLPFENEDKSNHIIQGCDVPTSEKEFEIYVKGARITKSNNLLCNFKILSPIPFWKMKQKQSFLNYLLEKKIFLAVQTLNTYQTVKIGGFIFVHNQIARRDNLLQEINERMNEGCSERIEIQIVPYVFTIGSGKEKIVTRTLAVEVATGEAEEAKYRMMNSFAATTARWKHSNSSKFKFFPFRPTNEIPEKAIRKFVEAQNVFLHSIGELAVFNMKAVDWKLPGKNITFRQYLMGARHPVTKETLCFAIEETTTEGKYYIVIKEMYVTYVKEWLQKIADSLDAEHVNWKEITKCEGKFRFTYHPNNQKYAEYTSNLLKQIGWSDSEKEMDITIPPPTKRRAVRKKTITFQSKKNAWSEGSDTISTLTSASKKNQNKNTQKTNYQKKTMEEKPEGNETVSTADQTPTVETDDQVEDDTEKRLLEKIDDINGRLDANIVNLKTSNTNTGLLVQKMLEQNERLINENKVRDERMDAIEKGMKINNSELKGMRDETKKSIKSITKVLKILYKKVSASESQVTNNEWEHDEDSTLEDILSNTGEIIAVGSKRKKDSNEREVYMKDTEPMPAITDGLSGMEEK